MLVNSTGISNLISLIFSLLKRWFSSQLWIEDMTDYIICAVFTFMISKFKNRTRYVPWKKVKRKQHEMQSNYSVIYVQLF